MNSNSTDSNVRDVVPVEARNAEIGALLGMLDAGTRNMRRELDDPDEVRTVVWSPTRRCTVRWIIHHVIEHEAYHLGQAVLLALTKEKLSD